MYIYNVTINIDESVHDEWMDWMKKEHIPEMLATGKFTQALMSRVMVKEQMGGITYSVQYRAKDRESLKQYYLEDAGRLHEKSARFKDKAVHFRTEMEIVHEQ